MNDLILNQNQRDLLKSFNKGKIHIWLHTYSKRRCTTSIEGLDDDLDLSLICKHMRRSFNTNGCVLEEKVIQFQGDMREVVQKWLVDNEVLTEAEAKDRIVVHG